MSVDRYIQSYPALEMGTSPHLRANVTTGVIMRNVVYALIPVCAYAVYAFGLSALLLILVSTGACVAAEHIACRMAQRPSTVNDWSAVITGLLLGLILPPGFPLWMAAVGGVLSIVLGKTLFGGLGSNVFNPALVGRAFLQATFPVAITTWTPAFAPDRWTRVIPSTLAFPFLQSPSIEAFLADFSAAVGPDAWAGATPLSMWKFQGVKTGVSDLFWGTTPGSTGEEAAWLILLGGIYLIIRKMMDWRIMVGVLGSIFLFSGVCWVFNTEAYPSPVFMLFSGGVMIGAVYMATDMVTSPVTTWGVWIYAVLIGFITVIIRLFGGLPEGIMYAILLGNAVTPLLNNATQPRVYGHSKAEAK